MKLPVCNELLSKEMTRKEFLLHLGILALAVTGISGLLKTLSDPRLTVKTPSSKSWIWFWHLRRITRIDIWQIYLHLAAMMVIGVLS